MASRRKPKKRFYERYSMIAYIDSYCGIFCGACSVRSHGETGRGDRLITCCGSVPKSELACGGCKSDTVYMGCRVCRLRDCAVDRGLTHCADCADYPCKMYKQWYSAAKILPHVHDAAQNLESIKRDGKETWSEAQKARWSCPNCGMPFSWYEATCKKCGLSLTTQAYSLVGMRRLLCRIALTMAYKRAKRKISRRERKGE
jgi:hypothetical protein